MCNIIAFINNTKVPIIWIISVIGMNLLLLTIIQIIYDACECLSDVGKTCLRYMNFLLPGIALVIVPFILTNLGIMAKTQVRIVNIIVWNMRIVGALIIIGGIYGCLTLRDD